MDFILALEEQVCTADLLKNIKTPHLLSPHPLSRPRKRQRPMHHRATSPILGHPRVRHQVLTDICPIGVRVVGFGPGEAQRTPVWLGRLYVGGVGEEAEGCGADGAGAGVAVGVVVVEAGWC